MSFKINPNLSHNLYKRQIIHFY